MQVNIILRTHKKMITYTMKEIEVEVKKIQEDLSYIVDLETLLNSIKTHKAYDALKALLVSPRPDVNEAARDCAKIKHFKQNVDKLNLIKHDPLMQAEGIQKITNKLEGEKLFSFCLEHRKIK
jgi:transposase